MTRPIKQVGDEIRELTDEEYADLLAGGWTPGDNDDDQQPE